MNIPGHALIHNVVTRWGSTFEIISRFLEQQQAVCAVLAGHRSTWHLMPKDNDIIVLEKVKQLLCPLHDFTDILASEEQLTHSSLKPVLEHINSDIYKEEEDDLLLQLTCTKELKNGSEHSQFCGRQL